MSQRGVRVNELVQQAISHLLHTDYPAESVAITITEVVVSPDLRQANIFYSVLGNSLQQRKCEAFLKKIKPKLKQGLSRAVILKYLPNLRFIYNPAILTGTRLINLIDQLEENVHN
jgi:ribosome-binding factor A